MKLYIKIPIFIIQLILTNLFIPLIIILPTVYYTLYLVEFEYIEYIDSFKPSLSSFFGLS